MDIKLEDINVGDEVYFESTNTQNNHDLYWKVIEKIKGTTLLIVQIDEMGYHDLRHTINIKEIKRHIKINH